MCWSDIDRVNFNIPSAFCLRPDTGRGFRAPPLRMRTLTIIIPLRFLYPNRRALSGLVGLFTLLITGSRRQVIAARLSHCWPTRFRVVFCCSIPDGASIFVLEHGSMVRSHKCYWKTSCSTLLNLGDGFSARTREQIDKDES